MKQDSEEYSTGKSVGDGGSMLSLGRRSYHPLKKG